MARIGIDVRCLAEGRKTGVEEYTLNFLKHLFEIDKKNKYVLFLNSFSHPKANFEWLKNFSNVSLKKFSYPNKLINFMFWYLGWPKIDKMLGKLDFFFMPNIIFGEISTSTKLILTIHDLSFERYPETFSWKKRLWHMFINPSKLSGKAKKIITVSNSSRNDLLSIYKANPEKVIFIPNGASEKFKVINRNDGKLLKVKEKYKLPYKFILYLGTIEPRKNIKSLIRAYNQLQKIASHNNIKNLLEYKLVIAGSPGWLSKEIFLEIEKSKNKGNVQVINFIDDEDKECVFNLASLFVYPSFFEGFGLPPLEAMGCGIPVIVSNCSSLPEVVGENGIMIDPSKPDEIFKAMKEILTDKELREKLIKKGLRQSKNFDWDKTAEEFLKIIS